MRILLAIPVVLAFTAAATAQTFPDAGSTITVRVGKTTTAYGVRGDCGGTPPTFAQAVTKMPKSSLGTYSDGGTASRQSRACGTVTVRVINFTGKKAGKESVVFYNDPYTLEVK